MQGAAGEHRRGHRVQVRGAVDDRGVHHLPLTAGPRLEQCGKHADHEVCRPAAEVADQVAREVRPLRVLAEPVQGAGDGDVVHVVSGRVGKRAGLPPAGHPAVDQPRIAGQALVRTEPESFGGPRPHALDQDVRGLDQLEDGLDCGRVLQVERDAGAATREQVGLPAAAGGRRPARPLDADHVRPEVGEDRAGVGAGADPGELDDLDPTQGAGALTEFNTHASASWQGRPDVGSCVRECAGALPEAHDPNGQACASWPCISWTTA